MAADARDVPPGPRAYPLVGALPALVRDPVQFLMDASRRHGDTLFLGKVLGKGLYVVSHPDHLRHILQENARNYVKGSGLEALGLVVGDGLVMLEGDHWKKHRRLLQPAFHRSRVAALVDQMAEVIHDSHERWSSRPPGQPISVSEEMMRVTQRVLLTTVLGVDLGSRVESLCEAWNVAFELLTERLISPPIHLPLSVPTPKHLRFRRAMKTLDDAIYGILREQQADETKRCGVISLLLGARDEETGEAMTEKELRDEVMTIFLGGFETSAVVLAWLWHVLGSRPDLEAKLHAEVDEVLGRRRPRMEDVPKLRYTAMLVQETLRLYPGAWVFPRANVGPDVVGRYPLPPGSIVFICPYLTHRHPDYWPDAEVFDPERFTPERSASRPRHAYIPFSVGPRFCIGESFAMTEMTVLVAMTAQRFRLRAIPGHRVKVKGMFTLRPDPDILMRVDARSAGARGEDGASSAAIGRHEPLDKRDVF